MTGEPGMLQCMGPQGVRHDFVTEKQYPISEKNLIKNIYT